MVRREDTARRATKEKVATNEAAKTINENSGIAKVMRVDKGDYTSSRGT